jgi:hypothetical protein
LDKRTSEAATTLEKNQIKSNILKCFEKLISCQTESNQNFKSNKHPDNLPTNSMPLVENED